jgi:hypothetical protein
MDLTDPQFVNVFVRPTETYFSRIDLTHNFQVVEEELPVFLVLNYIRGSDGGANEDCHLVVYDAAWFCRN